MQMKSTPVGDRSNKVQVYFSFACLFNCLVGVLFGTSVMPNCSQVVYGM